MHYRDQLRTFIQESLVLIEQQLARIVHRDHTQPRAFFFTEHLPRDNVGVMLHRRDDDLVALADEFAAVAVHHEIDAFGGAPHEDTFANVASVDEALHLFTRTFVGSSCFLAQVMNAAMNVRVFLFDVGAAAIDDDLRYLRRGRVVEIDEWFAVDSLLQDWEVSANAFDIPRIRHDRLGHYYGTHVLKTPIFRSPDSCATG